MPGISVTSTIKALQRDLDSYDKKRIKAARTAVKVEGFRLMKALKSDIKAGAPGGRPFSPLTKMATYRRGRNRKKPPLYRLAVPVRYRTDYRKGHMDMTIGFVDPYKGPKLSKSWKKIAKLHQSGGRVPVTSSMEKALRLMGARMKKRKITRKVANVFFLKKSTTHFDIPARPIIDPFWQDNVGLAHRNIVVNFGRKMRGEHI